MASFGNVVSIGREEAAEAWRLSQAAANQTIVNGKAILNAGNKEEVKKKRKDPH